MKKKINENNLHLFHNFLFVLLSTNIKQCVTTLEAKTKQLANEESTMHAFYL